MIFTCQCCDFSKEFATAEDAYGNGWDIPPYFNVTCCDLCPSSILFSPTKSHDSIHIKWDVEGRPDHWDPETCLEPEDRPTDMEEFQARIEAFMAKIGITEIADLKAIIMDQIAAKQEGRPYNVDLIEAFHRAGHGR